MALRRRVRRKQAPLSARVRYGFDARLARGPSSVILYLGVAVVIIVAIAALILSIFHIAGVNGGGKLDFVNGFYQSVLRVLDTGTVANDQEWPARLVGLVVTILGVFIAGSLIGLIANAVDQRLEELRRGRSQVLEVDHVLVLGWSARVPAIVSELTIANESERDAVVVVLADHDKTEMEEALAEVVEGKPSTRIVCRSATPWLPTSLDIANVADARTVVVVNDGSDSGTVMCLLGVRAAVPNRELPIVAEINNAALSTSVVNVFDRDLILVSSDDIVAELTAQACRRPGLTAVFRDLLDFGGAEIYMAPFAPLDGATYGQALLAFDTSSVMGIRSVDGTVTLNPPPHTVIGKGDQIIAVAEDDSTFMLAATPVTGVARPVADAAEHAGPTRMLIVGWSSLGSRVVTALDEFLEPGSTIEVAVSPELVKIDEIMDSVQPHNATVRVVPVDDRPESIGAHCLQSGADEVILLGYREALDVRDADARTLLAMLACAEAKRVRGGELRMVAEVLDQRTVPLAQASGADDFIVSEELVSRMLAQLCQNPRLDAVFKDLFDREGCAVELVPATRYGGAAVTSFADIVMTASSVGASAIGYRVAATGEVVLNPTKSVPLQLADGDDVVVIAERASVVAQPVEAVH